MVWCAHALDGLFQFGVPDVVIIKCDQEGDLDAQGGASRIQVYIGRTNARMFPSCVVSLMR